MLKPEGTVLVTKKGKSLVTFLNHSHSDPFILREDGVLWKAGWMEKK
ncbi:hypothetical protein BLGI_425 [Brevibacillus laterosporus GI-9]|nr:hypothetical protein BLGI_425 [Brevibacillus laterosporus GI-9]